MEGREYKLQGIIAETKMVAFLCAMKYNIKMNTVPCCGIEVKK